MNCSFPFYKRNAVGHWIGYPCGRCAPCRIAKAREWAVRMVMESDSWPNSAFLTLTYENDEVINLDKKVLQNCFKRARKRGLRFRYYACGEYGGRYGRPHYHVCLFYDGDLGFEPDSSLGLNNGRWGPWPFGLVNLGTFNSSSARYVADYLLKSLAEPLEAFRTPPFRLVSTKMGKEFFENNKDNIEANGITLNGAGVSVPRYFKDKFSDDAKARLVAEAMKRVDDYTLEKGMQREKNILAYQRLFRKEF